ncbi:MAG: hypothetical protein M1825_000428 [Sarcosagium campestre]|nr:MAG: hypothetical protein M1825_000428 [Sarcosagium campestre]
MEDLPTELIVYITGFLGPTDIVRLQLVSRKLFKIARDNGTWKGLCYKSSALWVRERKRPSLPRPADNAGTENLDTAVVSALLQLKSEQDGPSKQYAGASLANWDPTYWNEEVDWYQEYIQRNGPISLSWLQPVKSCNDPSDTAMDLHGMALYNSSSHDISNKHPLLVAPVADGSVGVWLLGGSSDDGASDLKPGHCVARSRPGLISPDDQGFGRSGALHGTIENISIDSGSERCFVAVSNTLQEVDLRTLQLVSSQVFEAPIAALSGASGSTPLTVGTSLNLYLHDPRAHVRHGLGDHGRLPGPSPVSILHAPLEDNAQQVSDDIFVAGRFPGILHYDRRFWPRLCGSIHSGARLSCLTSVPYPLLAGASRSGRTMIPSVSHNDATIMQSTGSTLLACGEYGGKGSLEVYKLDRAPYDVYSPASVSRTANESNLKNRQRASSSKLLAVAGHGTRLVYSDSSGLLKWVERDGVTPVRQWNVNGTQEGESGGIFATAASANGDANGTDVIRKLITVKQSTESRASNQDDILLWTGERVGLLSHSPRGAFSESDVSGADNSPVLSDDALRQQDFNRSMRRALESHADEVRFMQGLGLGFSRSDA